MNKIDTQGMSESSNQKVRKYPVDEHGNSIYPKMKVKPTRLFSQMFVKELKILMNEVLDERQGRMNYKSYFDVEDTYEEI